MATHPNRQRKASQSVAGEISPEKSACVRKPVLCADGVAGLHCKIVLKVNEGRPNAVDLMKAGQLQLVIYTATGAYSFNDEKVIRRTAVAHRIPCITTLSGARAAAEAVASRRRDPVRVWSLQEIHAG